MKYFYYLSGDGLHGNGSVIRVKANVKPSKRGSYDVEEFRDSNDWYFGPWKKVNYGSLKKMEYIGSTKV